jgi:hypothetical protein
MLTIPCPHCGSFNDETASVCYFCKKELPGAAGRPVNASPAPTPPARAANAAKRRPPEYERPGCVTLYALLLFLSGGFGIFIALFLPGVFANDAFWQSGTWREIGEAGAFGPNEIAAIRSYLLVYLIFLFLYSFLTFLMGWGLWTMRNWARILLLLVQGVSLITGLASLFFSIAVSHGSLFVCGANFVSLILPGWIFLWFLFNRRQFR